MCRKKLRILDHRAAPATLTNLDQPNNTLTLKMNKTITLARIRDFMAVLHFCHIFWRFLKEYKFINFSFKWSSCMGVHDITITLLKFSGFRQKLINGSDETQMEEEDVLAVGYEVTVSS